MTRKEAATIQARRRVAGSRPRARPTLASSWPNQAIQPVRGISPTASATLVPFSVLSPPLPGRAETLARTRKPARPLHWATERAECSVLPPCAWLREGAGRARRPPPRWLHCTPAGKKGQWAATSPLSFPLLSNSTSCCLSHPFTHVSHLAFQVA